MREWSAHAQVRAGASEAAGSIGPPPLCSLFRSLLCSPPSFPPGAEKNYYVLGNQHLVKALQQLRATQVAKKLAPAKSLTVIRARVLKHAAPIPYRQAAAGDSQCAQSGVRAIPLSG